MIKHTFVHNSSLTQTDERSFASQAAHCSLDAHVMLYSTITMYAYSL